MDPKLELAKAYRLEMRFWALVWREHSGRSLLAVHALICAMRSNRRARELSA